jgi:hypothetical protein
MRNSEIVSRETRHLADLRKRYVARRQGAHHAPSAEAQARDEVGISGSVWSRTYGARVSSPL